MEAGMILPFRNTGNISDPFIGDKIMGLRYAPLGFWRSGTGGSPRSRAWPDGGSGKMTEHFPPAVQSFMRRGGSVRNPPPPALMAQLLHS